MKFIIKILVVAASLWVAIQFVDGVEITTPTGTANYWGTLLVVALIFGVINAVIKPIIETIGCAFYVLTLGLFALVVNAGLMLLTSWISSQIDVPFHVSGFWAAFWGALVVSIVSWVLSLVLPD
ncbi:MULTISPECIES: phage holin family protein [Nonomuraea]|uniref:Phage holin family protein n=2 Tax=Nonomuraea TaxID=83681 RepID=A0ABN3RZG7_9ACTN|nr:phage holin family protein [Nonomuraea dietziae]MBB3731065.1 putative membrane protein [Nonomuraea dietziae]